MAAFLYGSAVPTGRSAAASVSVQLPPDEFQHPSWTALPPPTSFNTTPGCLPSPANGWYCVVPARRWPPADPYSADRYLNSGYWPMEKRPDIELYADTRFPGDYKDCFTHLVHYCYLLKAEAEGYPVSHTPHVGDLWFAPGRCIGFGPRSAVGPSCTSDQNWYVGYVEKVHPDGSFIASAGGSNTPADSGLVVMYISGATDRYSEFVHRFPPGKRPRSGFAPTTTRPTLSATLTTATIPAGKAYAVILNWTTNLPRAVGVTAFEGGKPVPNIDSQYSLASAHTTQPSLSFSGFTDPLPYPYLRPGHYQLYVTLTGTSLPPLVLSLTLT